MNINKLRSINKLYFGYEAVAKALGIASASAKVCAYRYARQGFLIRVKRNIYVRRDIWDSLSQEELFCLANIAQAPTYVSLLTALGSYEITTQVQRNFVESIAVKRTKELHVVERVFNYTRIKPSLYRGFVKKEDFFIATPEKALLDALYLSSRRMYSIDLSAVDFKKLDLTKLRKEAGFFPKGIMEPLKKYGIT
jgi:predicted transcriptional regulator of viral defense system